MKLLAHFQLILLTFVFAGCTATPSDDAGNVPTPGTIKGKETGPLSTAGKAKVKEALCILKELDPAAHAALTDPAGAPGIVALSDAVADNGDIDVGWHDNDTVGIFEGQSPQEAAATLAHEVEHQGRAKMAMKEVDPATNPTGKDAKGIADAAVAHFCMNVKDVLLLCAISNKSGMPFMDQAECPGNFPNVLCSELKRAENKVNQDAFDSAVRELEALVPDTLTQQEADDAINDLMACREPLGCLDCNCI